MKLLLMRVLKVVQISDSPILSDRKYVLLDAMCVDKNHTGKGVGRYLLTKAMEYTGQIGASSVELTVSDFNKEAIRFYESIGFKTRSRKMELSI